MSAKTSKDLHGFGFCLRFVAIFLVLQVALVFALGDITQPFMIETATVKPGVEILGLIFPHEAPAAAGDILRSKSVSLHVLRGCEGTEFYLLLAAAILAFAAPWRTRLIALAAGMALVFALNQARLVGLFVVVRDFREHFQLVHVYIAPLILVVVLVIVFALWASRAMPRPHST